MSTRLPSRASRALLVGLLAVACAKDPAAPAPVAGIVVVQGADQSAQVGKVLPTPVILRAIDSTASVSAETRRLSRSSPIVTGASALFRSCATPPARVPRLSRRWVRRRCSSIRRRSVTSQLQPTIFVPLAPDSRTGRAREQRNRNVPSASVKRYSTS